MRKFNKNDERRKRREIGKMERRRKLGGEKWGWGRGKGGEKENEKKWIMMRGEQWGKGEEENVKKRKIRKFEKMTRGEKEINKEKR